MLTLAGTFTVQPFKFNCLPLKSSLSCMKDGRGEISLSSCVNLNFFGTGGNFIQLVNEHVGISTLLNI